MNGGVERSETAPAARHAAGAALARDGKAGAMSPGTQPDQELIPAGQGAPPQIEKRGRLFGGASLLGLLCFGVRKRSGTFIR